MSSRKIVPITTKRLISSTFGFERPLTPPSAGKKLLPSENVSRFRPKEKNAKEKMKDNWEEFKKSTRKKSLFWIISSLGFALWLVILTIFYSIHIQNTDHSNLLEFVNRTIEFSGCLSDSDCSSPTPYCDTQYTNKCSECLSSSQCTSSGLAVCDIYGSRSCHQCVNDNDCSGSFICDRSDTRTCAECFTSKDCASNPVNVVCSTSNTCVQCAVNNDCTTSPNNVCSSSNVCIECAVNSDCKTSPLNACKSSTNTCVECNVNTDCTTSPFGVCKTSSNTCTQCLVNSDCSSNSTYKYCSSEQCVQCLDDSGCASQAVNKVCKDQTCVQCTSNKHCASQTTNKICDLSTNTCAAPCTTAACASRTDGKTKCCGTKCIENCPGGFICDVFQSQCVTKIIGTPRGTNVPTNATNILTNCAHCHQTTLKATGSLFKKSMLDTIDYLTGITYIFDLARTRMPNIQNAVIYFQEASNCVVSDINQSPYIELGSYSTLTTNTVDFDNILPVTSDCFFILTQGTYKTSFTCIASYDYLFQVVVNNDGSTPSINHTPYYELIGY